MNTPPVIAPSLDGLLEALIRMDVATWSATVLGTPYEAVQAIVYPRPPYRGFALVKRDGSPRLIYEPKAALKGFQESILTWLASKANPDKPCVHGFTKGRSIVTNAKQHCSARTMFLLNLDLQDFFPTITFFRIRGVLMHKPFECSHHVATVIAHMCTRDGVLPQGAPTSPFFSNLVCRSMDRELMQLARRHRSTYTRYADDMTFSFSVDRDDRLPGSICSFQDGALALGGELEALIAKHGFTINPSKTRMSTPRRRMEVTGIVINKKLNVKRSFIDGIRGGLNAWAKHGYDAAEKEWHTKLTASPSLEYTKRPWKRQWRTGNAPRLSPFLRGKLLFLRMVRGAADPIYNRLAERFNALSDLGGKLPTDKVARDRITAEKAVFLVECGATVNGKRLAYNGTAFAYKDVGLVTCAHVVQCGDGGPYIDEVDDGEIIVMDAVTNEFWPVKILHRDGDRDLAILAFDTKEAPNNRHFLAANKPIVTGENGWLIGFPDPSAGRRANQVHTDVQNVYGFRGLQRFDTREWIRAGNSGGPFVDEDYRVVGVAQVGAQQNLGSNRCLAVNELDVWIAQWRSSVAAQAAPTPPTALVQAAVAASNAFGPPNITLPVAQAARTEPSKG